MPTCGKMPTRAYFVKMLPERLRAHFRKLFFALHNVAKHIHANLTILLEWPTQNVYVILAESLHGTRRVPPGYKTNRRTKLCPKTPFNALVGELANRWGKWIWKRLALFQADREKMRQACGLRFLISAFPRSRRAPEKIIIFAPYEAIWTSG